MEPWIRDSLFALGGIYSSLGKNGYTYSGTRPGSEWHGHGYFPKTLTMLVDGRPTKVQLLKHRWKNSISGVTVHSRPPDDPVLLRFCSLIVFVRVWAWVSSPLGFHNRRELYEELESGCGSDRTVQRWTARAQQDGMRIQQAIRLSIIEKSEPRPVESLFEGGLSPPHMLTRKRWKTTSKPEILYRGYAMLLASTPKLASHASYLLAEARRRWPSTKTPFGI